MNIEYLINKYSLYIKRIYKTGSSVLPWITNSHDKDYIIWVEAFPDIRGFELFAEKPKDECWFLETEDSKLNPKIYSYQKMFEEVLYDDMSPETKYDIFVNDEYKQYITKYALGKPYTPQYKWWYHILTGIYLLDNGEYKITEEQAKNIQLCHDKQMSEELYFYIQQRLTEYSKEVYDENS